LEKKTLVGFGIGLLAGAAIGGAIALLYAPRSGRETRASLVETDGVLKEGGRDLKKGAADLEDYVVASVSGNGG